MWRVISRNNNYSVNEKGEVRNNSTGYIKSPTINKRSGYLCVDLYENNKRTKVPIHRLVAEAFIPNPDGKPTVDHKDGNRTNNSVSNLRWATYGEQNSRFDTLGVRSQKVVAEHYHENRNPRGGGHISWGEMIEELEFDRISDAAKYFDCTIGNISLMLDKKTIGVRGKTRGYRFVYRDSERIRNS